MNRGTKSRLTPTIHANATIYNMGNNLDEMPPFPMKSSEGNV